MATPPVVRVLERQVRVFLRFWRGSLIFSFLTPLFFLAAMGLGLGGLVDEGAGRVAGLPYATFLAPGLLAASVMQQAAGESLWPVMGGIKWQGTFQAMVATPLRGEDVYSGVVLSTAVRTIIGSAGFLLAATLLGTIPSPMAVLAVPACVLCAAAFAAPLTAFVATQDTDFRFPVIMRLGVVPLFLFSGTFFPVDQLPDRVQPLAYLSPLWHGVELTRGATTGHLEAAASAGHVGALLLVVALGWQWGVRTFPRRLTP